MAKTLRQLERQLPTVNAIIEVRDARIPLTSVNHQFDAMVRRFHKPRLVVFTKSDLADPRSREAMQRRLLYDSGATPSRAFVSTPSAYTVATNSKGAARLIKKASEGVRMRFKSSAAMMLIVGMPNAGKSTLINSLRSQAIRGGGRGNKKSRSNDRSAGGTGRRMRKRSRVAKTGDEPGVTKSVTSIQVSSDPTVFVLDTPGIMVPRVDDVETGLKLALTGALPERVVSVEAVVDYLHYVLRTQPRRALAPGVWDVLGMEEGRDKPPDSVQHMLDSVARRYGKNPQTEDAARFCIRSFQKGLLGKITLDSLDS
jgi:ribosome biogenesis GTPase A